MKENLLDVSPLLKLAYHNLKNNGFEFTPQYPLNEYDADYSHHLPDLLEEARKIIQKVELLKRCKSKRNLEKKKRLEARKTTSMFDNYVERLNHA